MRSQGFKPHTISVSNMLLQLIPKSLLLIPCKGWLVLVMVIKKQHGHINNNIWHLGTAFLLHHFFAKPRAVTPVALWQYEIVADKPRLAWYSFMESFIWDQLVVKEKNCKNTLCHTAISTDRQTSTCLPNSLCGGETWK